MSRERERGFRLAEAALKGDAPDASLPEFPRVTQQAARASVEACSGLERDIDRLRALPRERAEAELRFLRERRWIDA